MGADYRERQLRFHTYDGSKIADITHPDINEHTLTPADLGLPDHTVGFWFDPELMAGVGPIRIRTTTAGRSFSVNNGQDTFWPISDDGLFRYLLGVANDDWDIYCFGYLTQ